MAITLNSEDSKGFVVGIGYVTKGKPYLYNFAGLDYGKSDKLIEQQLHYLLNGTIPFRFWFEEYEEVLVQHHIDSEQIERVLKQACIEHDDLDNYVGNKETIYAWHIKKLGVFDKPMKLGNLYTWNESYEQCPFAMNLAEEYMTTEEILVNRE